MSASVCMSVSVCESLRVCVTLHECVCAWVAEFSVVSVSVLV